MFVGVAAVALMLGATFARAEGTLNVGAYPTNPPFETKLTRRFVRRV